MNGLMLYTSCMTTIKRCYEMSSEKAIVREEVNLWVPKEAAELGKIEEVKELIGDFEHLLLDNIRAAYEELESTVAFAEHYNSYEDYLAELKTNPALDQTSIEAFLKWAVEDKRLEKGKRLLAKGITSETLKHIVALLETCLDSEN